MQTDRILFISCPTIYRCTTVLSCDKDPNGTMAGSAMETQKVLIELKIPKGGTKKDLKDIKVTVKTESGEKMVVLSLSEPNDAGVYITESCFTICTSQGTS